MEEPPAIHSEAEQIVGIEDLASEFNDVAQEAEQLHRRIESYSALVDFRHSTLSEAQLQQFDQQLFNIKNQADFRRNSIMQGRSLLLANANQEELREGLNMFYTQLHQELLIILNELNAELNNIRNIINEYEGIHT